MHSMQNNRDADELRALRRLYPDLSDEEIEEVQDRLDRYFRVLLRILERIRKDPEAYERFKRVADEMKRSNSGRSERGDD